VAKALSNLGKSAVSSTDLEAVNLLLGPFTNEQPYAG
jgi:hypothetical protein